MREANDGHVRTALQKAVDDARGDWTDWDVVTRAQTLLEQVGRAASMARIDAFARDEMGWEASRYPADREWRIRIGTAHHVAKPVRTGDLPDGVGFVDGRPFRPPSVPRPHTRFGDLPEGAAHSFQAADTQRAYETCDWRDGGRPGPGRDDYADPSEPGEVVGGVVAWGDGPTEPRDDHERAVDLADGGVAIVRDFDPDDRILVAGRICARETWTNALNRYLQDTPYSVASTRGSNADPDDVRYRFGIARGDEPDYHRMDDVETVIGSAQAATFARGLRIGWESRG